MNSAMRSRPGGVPADSANERAGGAGGGASPGAGPATASRDTAGSSPVRVTAPATRRPTQSPGSARREAVPGGGLSQTTPKDAAGMRIGPPPGGAGAAPAGPAAPAPPAPPLEPPG